MSLDSVCNKYEILSASVFKKVNALKKIKKGD